MIFGYPGFALSCNDYDMTRINIEQLKTFLEVVRLGGMRKAASSMNLTQPTVTARIKTLEEALSCKLLERGTRGMTLTKRGELLLAHAEKIESLTELVDRDVVDPAGVERRLRLGVAETIAQSWLPDFVAQLHGLYPKLEIELNVDISTNLRTGILNREFDLAILLGPVSEYTVENIELPGFDLAWYAAANTSSGAPALDRLSRPVLTYARNTRPYRELKEMLFEHVGPDVSLFPSSSLSACFRLVEADLGIAALPRALGQPLVDENRIREFNPGFLPSPLRFSASFLGEPRSHIVETAARMAFDVAVRYLDLSDKKT